MTKTWCVGGRHYINTKNLVEYKKVNCRTKKVVKIIKGNCSVCGRKKSQFLLSKGLKEKILLKKENVGTTIVQL